MRVASAAGTPCAVRPVYSECGRLADSPMMIRVKKIPIESTMAEFWKVADMPAPAPRWSEGRLFMIPARFGDANKPEARP